MDASQALADLREISAQIEAAVIAERSGGLVASTIDDEERAGRFARAAAGLLSAAEEATAQGAPIQLEAVLGDGSVFAVREGDRLIAALTGPDPTVGLVFYDLKSCLRSVAVEAAEPPVRDSGPGEGVPGEPGGSPAAEQEQPPAAEPDPPPAPPKRTRKPKPPADTGEGTDDAEA